MQPGAVVVCVADDFFDLLGVPFLLVKKRYCCSTSRCVNVILAARDVEDESVSNLNLGTGVAALDVLGTGTVSGDSDWFRRS